MSAAHYTQLDTATASATADTLTLRGTSGEVVGAYFAGTSPADAGLLRGASNTDLVVARNAAGTGNLTGLATDASDNVLVGQKAGESGNLYLRTTSGGAVYTYSGATLLSFLNSSGLDLRVPLVFFGAGVSTPGLTQAATPGATGQDMTILSQSAATTGGGLVLDTGTGGTSAGTATYRRGGVTHFSLTLGLTDFSLPIKLPDTDPAAERQIGADSGGYLRVYVSGGARTVPHAFVRSPPSGYNDDPLVETEPWQLVLIDTTSNAVDAELPDPVNSPVGSEVVLLRVAGANASRAVVPGGRELNDVVDGTFSFTTQARAINDGSSWWVF